MLVLERKPGQSIVIELNGARVEVALIRTGLTRSKIGVKASTDVLILRKELLDREAA